MLQGRQSLLHIIFIGSDNLLHVFSNKLTCTPKQVVVGNLHTDHCIAQSKVCLCGTVLTQSDIWKSQSHWFV